MAKCAWRPDEGESKCASTAAENKYTLCEPHYAEMIRRAKVRRDGWKAKAMETNAIRANILNGLETAKSNGQAALLSHVAEGGTYEGSKSVVVGHSRTNSVFYNFVMGRVKAQQVRLPGWDHPQWANGAILIPVKGLSMEAARLYADAYNNTLSEYAITDTTAIVSEIG